MLEPNCIIPTLMAQKVFILTLLTNMIGFGKITVMDSNTIQDPLQVPTIISSWLPPEFYFLLCLEITKPSTCELHDATCWLRKH